MKTRVLIVEDELIISTHIKLSLQHVGYETTSVAVSGIEAIERAAIDHPDVVLMDIFLSGDMDGIETAQQIRSRHNIPIIFLTANADRAVFERAKITEPYAYILKPFHERELFTHIEMALDKHRIEHALKSSETRYRTLFEHMQDGVAIYRAVNEGGDFICVDFNHAGEQIDHRSGESVIGESVFKIFPNIQAVGMFDVFQRVWRTGVPESPPINFYQDDHCSGWREHFVYKLPTEEIVDIYRDHTEKRQAAEALQDSEYRYRHLIENAPVGIISVNRHGEIMDVNPMMLTLLDSPSIEATRALNILAFVPLIDAGISSDFQRCVELGNPITAERPYVSKWGKHVYLRYQLTPIYNPQKVIIGVQGIVEDFTDRKHTENELAQYQNHLEELVEERTKELSRINTQLEQEIVLRTLTETELRDAKKAADTASQAKSDFLANMSHELRTPLNAVLGYAQLLRSAENLTESQHEGIETIKRSGEHLLTLINEILDISKIEAGRMELHLQEVHLPEFLNYLANIIHIRAEQQGIEFLYTCDPNVPVGVLADEKRLREVLLNLLGNAVKFTRQGSVTFHVTRLAYSLPALPQPRVMLRFQVEDTGVGIVPEELETIFLPFQQGGKRQEFVEGTGLGLFISRKWVELMGGKLSVTSIFGQGSVFWFDLLLPEVDEFSAKTRTYEQKILGYKGAQRTIMVVDDERINRAILEGMLLPLGFHIVEAESGHECLEKAKDYAPDLIFLDLRMPMLDGFGTTQQIRQTDGIRNSIVIAVSASVFDETRQRALRIGFNDFLIKPIQFEKVVELLHLHLRLEWIYFAPEIMSPPVMQPTKFLMPSESLSDAECQNLREFARLGMAKELLVAFTRLERENPAILPALNALRHLTKQYQFERILEMIDTMEKHA